MKTIPEIGSRVRHKGTPENKYDWRPGTTGTVVEIYEGGDRCYDEEAGEYYITEHHVAVKVDEIPEYWSYPGTDRYAPAISKLELIK